MNFSRRLLAEKSSLSSNETKSRSGGDGQSGAETDVPDLGGSDLADGLLIRRIALPDSEMLMALEKYGREALGDSALDRWMLPVIAVYGLLYIGKSGRDIVGAAEIMRCMKDGDLYLEGFYIRPRFQGRGYGSSMLAGLIGMLRRTGFERLLATVDPENYAGRRIYKKTGFMDTEFLPGHYGPGRDRLLLSLDLRTGPSV